MTERYNNHYRVETTRAYWWDYGWNGAYFVTICTRNRELCLGHIDEGELRLAPEGMIASNIWQAIPSYFPYAELGDFVVMPNHVHGVILINKPGKGELNGEMSLPATEDFSISDSFTNANGSPISRDAINRVSTNGRTDLDGDLSPEEGTTSNQLFSRKNESNSPAGGFAGEKNPMLHDNLSRIIRWYKGRCTFEIRKVNPGFGWQLRFHDHIIPGEAEFQRISAYIFANPKNWDLDDLNSPE